MWFKPDTVGIRIHEVSVTKGDLFGFAVVLFRDSPRPFVTSGLRSRR